MGFLGVNRKFLEKIIDILYSLRLHHGEKKKVKDGRRQKLINSVKLSDTQKQSIDSFFENSYGRKIPYDWHMLYQSFTGKFSEKYFPEIF